MITTWLAVRPLDTIMVRDGRPFDAGAASTASSVLPAPNTFGGVVRTALDRDVHRMLGPVVVSAAGAMFPAPLDIVRDDRRVRRLAVAPRLETATSDLDDLVRLSHHLIGDGDPVPEWITAAGLREWLSAVGSMVPGCDVSRPPPLSTPPWLPELRLGLARRWSGPFAGTADPGMLYSMAQLRPRDDTRFLVGCIDPEPVCIRSDVVPFGGRGRLAEVSLADIDDPLPAAPTEFPAGRLVVYLATPALLTQAVWPAPDGARVCAVASSGPRPVATASPRGGFPESRRLVWAVPAGSLIFLTFDGPDAADEALRWSRNYHRQLLPRQSELRVMTAGVRLVTAGFGTCLTGRW